MALRACAPTFGAKRSVGGLSLVVYVLIEHASLFYTPLDLPSSITTTPSACQGAVPGFSAKDNMLEGVHVTNNSINNSELHDKQGL
ncbi:unnamed protein product [Caenorhabditis brenneri]